ncbi:Crp/Fnr family transcriptional regulator [Olsenella sp. YH-ols2217]|uniref:Crp/Fnr family transcriptional regulator n=1 Tax=Kribbibacterium absianum TaxID=3044210 RepID=A0ABT6ZLF2_9ACTN|nr:MULTISPECIES: Crp/Fnr family transcriptional regulator [unclassified Olsenella]MDJ1121857.1 Crp/Fnr family transcriptional regulator [Olsenella sp. YH-ols2216]MDJ1129865.1 Crp/Fnr family transcriptional regulator [Olsenella sp. YH-ols2217]
MESLRIADVQLFEGVANEDADVLARELQVRTRAYDKGERLLRAGQRVSRVGIVLAGRVLMEGPGDAGDVTVMGWASPGDSFGEAYAMLGDRPLMVDATAVEPSVVAWLSVDHLWRQALEQGDSAAAQVLRNLMRLTAERNVRLSQRALHTAPRTVRGRLRSLFATLPTDSEGWVTLPVTQGDLANYLSVNRSVLSSELAAMVRDGEVERDGKRYRIG